MDERQDLYSVLGVAPDASPAEIAHAYRALVRRHHPDSRSGADVADHDGALQRVLVAHAILSDPQRRAEYDRSRAPHRSPRPITPQPVVVLGHFDSPVTTLTREQLAAWEAASVLLRLLLTLDDEPW